MQRDDETLDPRESRRKKASSGNDVVVLEVLFHPDLSRIGDRAVLGSASDPALACALSIGRDQPLFVDEAGHGRGLSDPCVSRQQIAVRWVPALGAFALEAPASARRAVRAFSPLGTDLGTAPLDAPSGAWLTIGDRIALRLSVERAGQGHLATGIVGSSRALADLRESCAAFARLEQAVLIWGPVGAGKERAARAIHLLGPRAGAPFVALNCAAVTEGLAESELFGHVRGAFSGATTPHTGIFEAAQGGTVLLDEVGELGLSAQAKLLRVLQEKAVRPVGAAHERPVDVRVLAATHRDLARDVAAGRFRADLLSRLSALRLTVPPLSEHREDIPLLFTRALATIAERTPDPRLSALFRCATDDAPPLPMALYLELLRREYPHNVRELEALAARVAAAVLCGDVPDASLVTARAERSEPLPQGGRPPADRIAAALGEHEHSIRRVAQTFGVSHSTVDRWMRELGLPRACDLDAATIEQALAASAGAVAAAARALSVSERGLVLRMRELGLTPHTCDSIDTSRTSSRCPDRPARE
ncbi:MAG: sigma-54-dependent Fis family transcriptional regulator [Polyangiaceae bacterium]|nr:sigma-54-dependent Fis family transcriptional regulator [Polyangiaceae bacterium]